MLHRLDVRCSQKRGGEWERPSGAKVVRSWPFQTALLFLSPSTQRESASPHEVTLVEATLESSFLKGKPERLVGDKAYDSDPLDESLKEQGIEMIAPHRRNRKKKKTQDGRKLRRYKRRWNIERLFAWLQNFRRLVVRYEYRDENFLGMAQLGCIIILLRKCL
jgi:transposase